MSVKIRIGKFDGDDPTSDREALIFRDDQKCGTIQALVERVGVSQPRWRVGQYHVTLDSGAERTFDVKRTGSLPPSRASVGAARKDAIAWIHQQLGGKTSPVASFEGPYLKTPVPFASKAHDDGTADLSGCVLCGRPTPGARHFVELAHGGFIVRPKSADTNDPGYMGLHPIGTECRKKVPDGYVVEASGRLVS